MTGNSPFGEATQPLQCQAGKVWHGSVERELNALEPHTTMIKTIIPQKTPLLTALMALLLSSVVSAETIRYGVISPPNHLWSQVLTQFKTNLEESTGAGMKVKESRLAKVRGEANIIEMLKKGQIQIGIVAAGGLTTLDPSLNGWLVPYQFTKVQQMEGAATGDDAKAMLAELGAHNLVALGYTFSGMRQILSPTRIDQISELKGKRVGSYANDVFYNWYRQLGIDPQPLQIQDALVKLNKGELDAVDCDLATAVGLKLYEAAPHLLLTNHMAFPGVFTVSEKWWVKLSPEKQQKIIEAFRKAARWGAQKVAENERKNLQALRDQGVTIMRLDESDFSGVPKKLRDFYYSTNPRLKRFGLAVK